MSFYHFLQNTRTFNADISVDFIEIKSKLVSAYNFTIIFSDFIEQCSKIMTENTLRYLPVFENNKLVNLISQNDIIKYTIDSQKYLINICRTI